MKNLLALAAAAVLAFVVVGYFLGWYQVQTVKTQTGQEYKVDVNSPKITEDLNKGKAKIRNWLNQGQKPGENSNSSPGDGLAGQTNQQIVRPIADPPPLPVPATFKTTEDGTIVFPGSTSTPSPR